jgi:acyl dehydratase
MKDEMYFEDFKVGDRFKIPSRTMTDAHFLFFAGMTGDSHPIHYDEEYCKRTRFGSRVAHGLLLAGMTALGASNLSAAMENSVVAFAEQSSRFLKPVFIGDTLSVVLEVAGVEPKRSTGVVRMKTRMTNQRGEEVLEGSHTYLFKRREAGQG